MHLPHWAWLIIAVAEVSIGPGGLHVTQGLVR